MLPPRKPEQRVVISESVTGMYAVCVEQTIWICLWEEGFLYKQERAVDINCLLLKVHGMIGFCDVMTCFFQVLEHVGEIPTKLL